ncbi:MAG: sugar ABC transporter substrate-binding protein [Candidatus Eisenbacteria bacterium]
MPPFVHPRMPVLLATLFLAAALGCAREQAREGVTIRMWAMGREGEVVGELLPDFEREHPGVHVVVQQIPWSAAHEKLLTAHVGHSTPDVAQLGNSWIPEFAALNAVEPLDRFLAGSASTPQEAFFPGIWETNVVDQVTYGLPWYVDTRVLFYRKDLLRRAGYDAMPTTWAEWRRSMERIKAQVGPDRFAIFLPLNEWNPPFVLAASAGSSLLNAEGTRGAFQEPAFRRGFEFYLALFRDHLAPPINDNGIANLYQEFERGFFAMYITGPWNIGEFRRRLSPAMQDAWATAPLPGPDGAASGLSMAGGSSLVVFRGSQHKAEGWMLLEYLARPEVQARFYRLTGDLPARREAWTDSTLVADPAILAFGEQLQRVAPAPRVPEWEQITMKIRERVESVVMGGVSADSALAGLDRDADRILEKRRWLVTRAHTKGAPR